MLRPAAAAVRTEITVHHLKRVLMHAFHHLLSLTALQVISDWPPGNICDLILVGEGRSLKMSLSILVCSVLKMYVIASTSD